MTSKVWQPVADRFKHNSVYTTELTRVSGEKEWWIAVAGTGTPLPDNIRLCELVDAPPTVPPSPGQAGMPVEVRAAIIEVTNWVDDWTKDGDDGFDGLAAACHHIYRWLDSTGAE